MNSFKCLMKQCVQAVCKLCARSLPRRIDNLDETIGESDISQPTTGTSTEGQMTSVDGMPNLAPPSSNSAIPWCKCGMYQIMPQEIYCDDSSTHVFMKAAYWQNVLHRYGYLGKGNQVCPSCVVTVIHWEYPSH